MAAMVNMNNLLNGKDSRWLQLEVCREFQRNKCSRQDTECKFAHPPANVEVQNGKVTACYDSIKGRCNREKPPCKYFHPPQHLKDQLLINGRNHLALKNALMQQMGISPGQPVMPGQVPAVDVQNGTTSVQRLGFSMAVGAQPVMATSPYLTGIPASTYSPYFAPGHLVPTLLGPDPSTVASQLGPVVPQAVPVAQQKIPRSDRIEVCREFMRGACKRAESECRFAHPQESVTTHEDGSVTVCMDAVKGRCARDPCRYFHPPLHLQAQIKAAQSRATATVPVSAAAAAGPILTAAAAATLTHPIPTPGAAQHHAVTIGHTLEVGKKRAAENDMFQLMDMKTVGSFYYENFAFSGMVPYKRPAAEKSGIPVYQPGATTYQQLMQLQQPFVPVSSLGNNANVPPNAPYVIYTDSNGQLLDTLPVCQDFNRSMCSRLNCRFVHLMESDKVEVCDQRVAVCRDHANGQCKRKQCKYYHIPIVLPPANVMATIYKTQHPQLVNTNPNNNNNIGCVTNSNNNSNTITTTNSSNNNYNLNNYNHKNDNFLNKSTITPQITAPVTTETLPTLMSLPSTAAPQSMLLPSSIVASSSSLSSLPQSAISTITAAAAANILASKSMTTSSILSSSPSSGLGSTGMIATVGGTTVAQVDTTDVTSTSTCIKNLFINNHHHSNNNNNNNNDSTSIKTDNFVNLLAAANNGSIIGVNSTNSNTNLFSLNAAGNSNNNDCNSNFITLSVPSSTQQPQVPCNSSASSANIIDHSASTTAKGTSMYLL
ncbi:uncharacterized protein LOC119653550 isoform X14 [Hermetia illucens]|uniref:uncharacterized protein LOC119653550 isoform X14 n=1 Tax=Hermetia illucens TaxID=343691 RepID=UPI0018CC386A|nr:uncharacterized protein LOC119653550 isoform X14 [Hermetia illucens]